LADTLVLPADVSLGDLYAGLGKSQTYRIIRGPGDKVKVDSLWGDVFDAPFNADKPPKDAVHTARSPEFLMYYMNNQPDEKIKSLYTHSYTEGNAALPPGAFDQKFEDLDRR